MINNTLYTASIISYKCNIMKYILFRLYKENGIYRNPDYSKNFNGNDSIV